MAAGAMGYGAGYNHGARNNQGYSYGHDGYRNDRYRNDGYRNDGYRNDGYRNDGYRNDGYRNDGYRNDGHRNDGYRNNGQYNHQGQPHHVHRGQHHDVYHTPGQGHGNQDNRRHYQSRHRMPQSGDESWMSTILLVVVLAAGALWLFGKGQGRGPAGSTQAGHHGAAGRGTPSGVGSQQSYVGPSLGGDSGGCEEFPDGEWGGYYTQRRDTVGRETTSLRRDDMTLMLRFRGGEVTGQGQDALGLYRISGRYNGATRRCAFSKRYEGEDYVVEYRGERSGCRGLGLRGKWFIRDDQQQAGADVLGGDDEGCFRLWPKNSEWQEDPSAEGYIPKLFEASAADECIICYEAMIDTALAPCGHVCSCMACSLRLEKCPICRTPVKVTVPHQRPSKENTSDWSKQA